MRRDKERRSAPDYAALVKPRPLSALLSQVLVTFTVEFDNEFERRMAAAGDPGAKLSLMLWSNLVRFLAAGPLPVHELAARASADEAQIKFRLGCLERWRFIVLEADASDTRPIPERAHRLARLTLRDGWGSGRGIRSGWNARLTERGRKAAETWPPLFSEIEGRWKSRFGEVEVAGLREPLEAIASRFDLELPQGLPAGSEERAVYPVRGAGHPGYLPLPALLSKVLLAFAIEFNRESPAPLVLCANTLRVLGESPIPVSQIPRLTGGSPETSDIGWQVKPYVVLEPDPKASRGKVVRLSPRGLSVQQRYHELVTEIENRWEVRYGQDTVRRLRESLRELFVPRSGDRLLLAEGLIPAEGTVRSGTQSPALGRRDVGAAALQRMRDLVAQTEMFIRDPVGTLPHYPAWDMNRGFGP